MIALYLVLPHDIDETPNKIIYTVSDNKKDCIKYINNLLMIRHKPHYSQWCLLHNEKVGNSSWDKYVELGNVLDTEFNNFIIKKIGYNKKTIASILRMFNRCVPIGGYESEEETMLFLNSIPEDKRKELERELEKQEGDTNNVQ